MKRLLERMLDPDTLLKVLVGVTSAWSILIIAHIAMVTHSIVKCW